MKDCSKIKIILKIKEYLYSIFINDDKKEIVSKRNCKNE